MDVRQWPEVVSIKEEPNDESDESLPQPKKAKLDSPGTLSMRKDVGPPYSLDKSREAFIAANQVRHRPKGFNTRHAFRFCYLCLHYSESRSDAEAHMSSHVAEGQLVCSFCELECSTSEKLKNHMMIHIGGKPFGCNKCNESFLVDVDWKRHMSTHEVTRTWEVFSCDYCEYVTRYNYWLNEHIRSHTGETPFECETCGTKFSQRRSLTIHQKRHCSG